ncbi:exonuclease subunit SbcD [Virgibacillus dakarensis]|uniref:Nuclease SbcCD subunit D n=1 Tax=Lentibacillus populi TaxID=1827502 RepID=A0A9W5X842_9BACI|nr:MULTISPECIES: exonuclease SbcCD subunit D [Bacillaceae]MBT2218548.1 exonuclease SbcCD subunit D [Virgibacillus dakarensis]MTW85969.1 exonuclease subunit SbcD [Virgibacillus dakarensis]GGB61883.1 nuclease SbcCD subunit D [Lentibacillus populi]
MKLLHTADWHLGKIVNSVHMTEEQDYVLNQLMEIVKEEQPDCLIIAGDLYDRAVPPKEAVELLNKMLTTLIIDCNIPVLAIAGNHDSPDRLEFGNQLFRSQQLYIETKLSAPLMPITIHDEFGPVHFHLIPYVEPAEVRSFFDNEEITSHHTAMEAIIDHIKQNNDMKERHLFIGHAFLAGGMESESEERLSMVGGSPYIDASLFSDFSYVAFGHLHQAQRITRDTIRYSGSILKYSFSEANHNKSVTIVEMNETGHCDLRLIPLIPKHDMKVVEGYFQELMDYPVENTDDFLHIRLLDEGEIIDPMNKLRSIYPNILRLERKGLARSASLGDLQQIRQQQSKSHSELFSSFFEEIKGAPITAERKQYVEKIVTQLLKDERGE